MCDGMIFLQKYQQNTEKLPKITRFSLTFFQNFMILTSQL